jgi:hypothetical protein
MAGAKDGAERMAARKQFREQQAEYFKQTTARRDKLLAELEKLLNERQLRLLARLREAFDYSPRGQAVRWARAYLRSYSYGVELSEAQTEQFLRAVVEILEPAFARRKEIGPKLTQAYAEMRKARSAGDDEKVKLLTEQIAELGKGYSLMDAYQAAREKLHALLTPEQQAAIEQARRKRDEAAVDSYLRSADFRFREFTLSDEQKQKMAELKAAARSAMLEIPQAEYTKRMELYRQLTSDMTELLTDEQKQMLNESNPYGGQGQGGQNRRGQGQPQ